MDAAESVAIDHLARDFALLLLRPPACDECLGDFGHMSVCPGNGRRHALAFQNAHVPSVEVMPGRAALLHDCFLYADQADLARKRSVGPADPTRSAVPGGGTSTPAFFALMRNPAHELSGKRP